MSLGRLKENDGTSWKQGQNWAYCKGKDAKFRCVSSKKKKAGRQLKRGQLQTRTREGGR